MELKKGRASDYVVGQIQRYMGYVLEELAEDGQEVCGVIIALEDDIRIRRALAVAKNIDFYRYQVSFKLFKNWEITMSKVGDKERATQNRLVKLFQDTLKYRYLGKCKMREITSNSEELI